VNQGRLFGKEEGPPRSVDLDHLHPNLPPPFDGSLLQIMPWPTFQNMTDHDLRAIYEYLSAIPCIQGPPAPDPLHNDCQ